jgi:hypothetical protein
MSYDLFLRPRAGALDWSRVEAWASSRMNYASNGSQIWYENEDTGVYFVIEPTEAGDDAADLAEDHYPLSVNINYFRPSFFALEIAPELARLVQDLDLLVMDPQTEGMGEGEFDIHRFHAGWNHGNAFGYSAVLRDQPNREGMVSYPAQVLASTWRWNHTRHERQDAVGELHFVPRIMFLTVDGVPATAMVWGDAMPVVLTEVDYLLVARKELAPRRFLSRREDTVPLRWADAQRILQGHARQESDGSYVLTYAKAPKDVQDFIRNLPASTAVLSLVRPDTALDAELVELALRGSGEPG